MRSCRFGGIFESDPDENSDHSLHDSCKQVNCTSKNSPYTPAQKFRVTQSLTVSDVVFPQTNSKESFYLVLPTIFLWVPI